MAVHGFMVSLKWPYPARMKSLPLSCLLKAFVLLIGAECLAGTAVARVTTNLLGAGAVSSVMIGAAASAPGRLDPVVVRTAAGDTTISVPEAHAALLGSIGLMCLLRRRRP